MAINTPLTVFVGNDTLFSLSSLTNNSDSSVITGASPTVTIKDSAGTEITGETWPLTIPETATPGDYLVTLESAIDFVANNNYTAIIDVNHGPGLVAQWEIPLLADTRIK